MSPQDQVERVLKEIHLFFAQCELVADRPGMILVDQKRFIDLLERLNYGIYDLMDKYEQTRERAGDIERQARRQSDQIIEEAESKADDVYAASLLFSAETVARLRDLIDATNDSMNDLMRGLKRSLNQEKDELRRNETELTAHLTDLSDTRKYLQMLEDIDRKREQRKREMEEERAMGLAFARGLRSGRNGDDALNRAQGGRSKTADSTVDFDSQKGAEDAPEIIVNTNAEYFKWKEQQDRLNGLDPESAAEAERQERLEAEERELAKAEAALAEAAAEEAGEGAAEAESKQAEDAEEEHPAETLTEEAKPEEPAEEAPADEVPADTGAEPAAEAEADAPEEAADVAADGLHKADGQIDEEALMELVRAEEAEFYAEADAGTKEAAPEKEPEDDALTAAGSEEQLPENAAETEAPEADAEEAVPAEEGSVESSIETAVGDFADQLAAELLGEEAEAGREAGESAEADAPEEAIDFMADGLHKANGQIDEEALLAKVRAEEAEMYADADAPEEGVPKESDWEAPKKSAGARLKDFLLGKDLQ